MSNYYKSRYAWTKMFANVNIEYWPGIEPMARTNRNVSRAFLFQLFATYVLLQKRTIIVDWCDKLGRMRCTASLPRQTFADRCCTVSCKLGQWRFEPVENSLVSCRSSSKPRKSSPNENCVLKKRWEVTDQIRKNAGPAYFSENELPPCSPSFLLFEQFEWSADVDNVLFR